MVQTIAETICTGAHSTIMSTDERDIRAISPERVTGSLAATPCIMASNPDTDVCCDSFPNLLELCDKLKNWVERLRKAKV